MSGEFETSRWRKREDAYVEAMQLDESNAGAALRWIVSTGGDAYADSRGLVLVTGEAEVVVPVGAWVVFNEDGSFSAVANTIFHIAFDPA